MGAKAEQISAVLFTQSQGSVPFFYRELTTPHKTALRQRGKKAQIMKVDRGGTLREIE
jgi:hypothetical protein